jgi:hypothetical protein
LRRFGGQQERSELLGKARRLTAFFACFVFIFDAIDVL